MIDTTPLFTDDTIVFGLLMSAIALIFYTESRPTGFWHKFYKIVPGLFMAYMIPALFTTLGWIAPDWDTISPSGELTQHSSNLYYVASRYLLPAALVLMTLSIDLKGVVNLGWKALIMFFTGTLGIIIGGPIAILLISLISPETVGANIWMALLLIGIGKSDRINKWLRADTTAIETLKEKVSTFTESVKRTPTLTDIMIMIGIAFGTVSFAHLASSYLAPFFSEFVAAIESGILRNIFTFLGSSFFWMISISTLVAVSLSFTKAKNYEGSGASKFGSVFIYILVASIGMKMDLTMIFDNSGLIAIGVVWMTIHAVLLIAVAKLIRAPYFFLAVGSQANVGGAASAPIVASAFHPSLASVGVILAVFGYAIGTIAAIACTILMELAAATA